MSDTVFQEDNNKNALQGLTKFRTIRQLLSSVACLVVAFFFMRLVLKNSANDKLLYQILIFIMSAGMFYCSFGVAHWLVKGIFKNGLIKKNKTSNYLVDTIIYVCLSAGILILLGFICTKIVWLGILFGIGGAFEVGYDINYISKIDLAKAN